MSILSYLFKKSIHGDSFNKSYKDEDNNTNSIDCSELLNEKEIFLLHYLYGRKIAWKIDDPVKSLFKDFDKEYLKEIQYVCLIMTEEYINNNYNNIQKYRNIIENRIYDENINKEKLIKENKYNLEMSKKFNNRYILIDDKYEINLEI